MPQFGYIYLLQTREAIRSEEDVYKIGRTKNLQKRLGQYSGHVLYFVQNSWDPNTHERQLIDLFRNKFLSRKDYGQEYFEGKIDDMEDTILTYFRGLERPKRDLNKETMDETEKEMKHTALKKKLRNELKDELMAEIKTEIHQQMYQETYIRILSELEDKIKTSIGINAVPSLPKDNVNNPRGKKTRQCEDCGKTFASITHYQRHQNRKRKCSEPSYIRVKDKYQCPFCEKMYNNQSSVSRHMKSFCTIFKEKQMKDTSKEELRNELYEEILPVSWKKLKS